MKSICLFLLFLFSGSLFSQDITEGLLIHYKFNSDFSDNSQNEFDGINHNTGFTTDRFGRIDSAAYFNGVDNYIEFPNLEVLKPQLPLSFSFWIKYDEVNVDYSYLLSTSFEENRSAGVFFNTEVGSNKYGVTYGDGSYGYGPDKRRTLISGKTTDNENWHHVAVVVNGPTNMKIFVDCRDFGGDFSGTGWSLTYSDNAGNLGRGKRNTGDDIKYFKGSLDDFYYWDREITEEEIGFLCTEVPDMSTADTETEDFILSPNPVKDILTIHNLNSKVESVQIFNHSGQLVMNQNKAGNLINVSHLNPGTYLVKINSGKKVISKKFIKR